MIDSTVERQRRRRPGRRDLHARRRRHDHQLDAQRQPRRRPRRRDLGRGVGDRRSTRRSRATWPSRTSAAGWVARATCTSATRRSATTTPRARAAACTPAGVARPWSTRPSPTTSRPVGREHRRRRAAGRVRLGHRPGQARQHGGDAQPTDSELRRADRHVARLQRRHATRRAGWPGRATSSAWRRAWGRCVKTAAGARRSCRALSARRSDWFRASPVSPLPFAVQLEGEQHLAAQLRDLAGVAAHRPARSPRGPRARLRRRGRGGAGMRTAAIVAIAAGGCAAGRGFRGRRGLALAGHGRPTECSSARLDRSCASSSDKVELMELSADRYDGLGGLPAWRARERVRRPRPPVRIPLRRARRLWPQLHARARRRPQAARRTRGLPLPRLRAIARAAGPRPRSPAGPPTPPPPVIGRAPRASARPGRSLRALERRVVRLRRARETAGGGLRALRRVGVVRVVGARSPSTATRTAASAIASASWARRRCSSGRRCRSIAATGTTPTTCSWRSSAATGPGRTARTSQERAID